MASFLAVAAPLRVWARLRIRASLRRHLDPEDIVQEIGVHAFTGYHTYDPHKGSFRSWIFGIATRVFVKRLRELQRSAGTTTVTDDLDSAERSLLQDLPASITSTISKVVRSEELQAVYEEAEQLSGEDRWLLIYRGLEQLDFQEIGHRMNLHPENVRTRWRRLLQALRERPNLARFLDDG